jgi:hypothetical protein
VYAATLACGRTLVFEARSLSPSRGELVPCLAHGYCLVEQTGVTRGVAAHPRLARRSSPRRQEELVTWLHQRSSTTLEVLRRHRFPLRMVVAAERAGLVSIDLDEGTVVVLPTARCHPE